MSAARENTRRLVEEAKAKEQAAARVEMPHVGPLTRPENCVAVQHEAVTPAFAAAPKPKGDLPAMRPDLAAETGGSGSPGTIPDRFHPTADAIVNAVAQSFRVSDEVAYGWIVDTFSNQRRVVA